MPKDPDKFMEKTINCVKELYKVSLVHADLSEFNILNFEEEPVFIDFSQATTLEHPQALEYLRRDIDNVCKHFRKLGLKADSEEVYKKVTS
jgi:RIO kinase 1